MHLIDDETLARLKTRWVRYSDYLDDPKLADPEVVPVMVLLNQIHCMATIFSCQGHPVSPRFIGSGSLMLGVTDSRYVHYLYEKLTELFNVKKQVFSLALTHKRDVTLPNTPDCPWYKVWVLRWTITPKNQELVWAALRVAAELTLAKYKEDSNLIG